jgi:hypothetical protein
MKIEIINSIWIIYQKNGFKKLANFRSSNSILHIVRSVSEFSRPGGTPGLFVRLCRIAEGISYCVGIKISHLRLKIMQLVTYLLITLAGLFI